MSAPTQVGGVGGWDTKIGAALSSAESGPYFIGPNGICEYLLITTARRA